jgi:hypothetical protein
MPMKFLFVALPPLLAAADAARLLGPKRSESLSPVE